MTVRDTRRGRRIWQHTLAGATGGLVAGAFLGIFEVGLATALQGSPTGLRALPYAAVLYGLLYIWLGLASGLAWGLWMAWRRPARPADTWLDYTVHLGLLLVLLVVAFQMWDAVLQGLAIGWEETGLLLAFAFLIPLDLALILVLALWRWIRRRAKHLPRRLRSGWATGALLVILAGIAGLGIEFGQELSSQVPPTLRRQPNVIIIVADALRADRLGCHGYPAAQTPHIDALAADGVLYRNMSTQASWTRPSVATILTSLYPSSHQTLYWNSILPNEITTLPEVLSSLGYRTAGFTTNVNMVPLFNFQQGFQDYAYLDTDVYLPGSQMPSHLTLYTGLLYWLTTARSGDMVPRDYYQDAAATNARALDWITANRKTRFFLYVHYMEPHEPYFEHPYNGRAMRSEMGKHDSSVGPRMSQLYDGEIAYLDQNLGEFFDTLKRYDLYDNTLIIFTADHGEEFYEHGGWDHGETLYQEMVHVPLIIKYPTGAFAGTVDEDPARSLDIAPTVLDVLNIDPPATMQGFSLHPDSRGRQPATVFSEEDHEGNVLQAIRMGNHKLILANEDNPRGLALVELYDLAADPGEQTNLSVSHPEVVERLRRELDRTLAYARARAVAGQTGELDPATRERLRQLGY